MIEKELYRVNKARSSKERILAFSFWLSLIAHGLFFQWEWLILGVVLASYGILKGIHYLALDVREQADEATPLNETDLLFFLMTGLSLFGLINPVKAAEGWLEALRWLIFWMIYRWSRDIANHSSSQERLKKGIEMAAIVIAGVGWLPWASLIWSSPPLPEAGRLSSWFGYPNAIAAFLGAVLLLNPPKLGVRIFLGVSLLSTGSRAAVGLYLLLTAIQGAVERYNKKQSWIKSATKFFQRIRNKKILLGWLTIPLVMSSIVFLPAWKHLSTWGFFTSSWANRLEYFRNGLQLAWLAGGLPRAGGWYAFPVVQQFPYWTSDPHSSIIRVLLNQGIFGILIFGIWGFVILKKMLPLAKLPGSKNHRNLTAALLFLALHSFVDADFSFGALGILFWLLAGLSLPSERPPKFMFDAYHLKFQGLLILLIGILLFAFSSSALVKPEILEKGQAWSAKAQELNSINPQESIKLWEKSVSWDQSEISWRKKMAEAEIKKGELMKGLEDVEEVLKWESFNLGAYEWAQGVILNAAQAEEKAGRRPTAEMLYQWVQEIPSRIEQKAQLMPLSKRRLWVAYENFKPTPYIEFLAKYARQRQLAGLQS